MAEPSAKRDSLIVGAVAWQVAEFWGTFGAADRHNCQTLGLR